MYMLARYKNKTVKVLSKTYDSYYLILINDPTEEKHLTFTIRDILECYGNIEHWKKACHIKINFGLKEGEFYKWVNKYHLFFTNLIMETE